MFGRRQNGLDHLHNLGLNHNDINPANIMLDKEDVPIIIDFNSCQREGDLSFGIGTPGGRIVRSRAQVDIAKLAGSKKPAHLWITEVFITSQPTSFSRLLKYKISEELSSLYVIEQKSFDCCCDWQITTPRNNLGCAGFFATSNLI